MTVLNLMDEARFRPMERTTTPARPGQAFLRERAIAAEKRITRKRHIQRGLVWLSIVANFGWPIVLFNVIN